MSSDKEISLNWVYFMAVLASIFWGASFAGAKIALEQASPNL